MKADGGVKWINSNIIKHKKELKKKVTWKIVELAEASVLYIYIYIDNNNNNNSSSSSSNNLKKKKLSVTCLYTTHVSVYQAQKVY